MSCDNCDCNNSEPIIQRIEIKDWQAGILEITAGNTDGPR